MTKTKKDKTPFFWSGFKREIFWLVWSALWLGYGIRGRWTNPRSKILINGLNNEI